MSVIEYVIMVAGTRLWLASSTKSKAASQICKQQTVALFVFFEHLMSHEIVLSQVRVSIAQKQSPGTRVQDVRSEPAA
jgi:hypothetical protein